MSRLVVYTHRWLGILLGVLFAGWFVSGVVLMYAGMPRLDPAERLAHRPALDFSQAIVAPSDIASAAGAEPEGLQLSTVAGRLVYRLRLQGRTSSFYADNGRPVAPFSVDDALREARAFASPADSSTVRFEETLTGPDQWTLEIGRQLPMHRIALGDGDDSRIYVSASSGDLLLKTTTATRRWAYPGAILHWIYLTPIRAHAEAWAQLIIWTSLAGTITAVVGLAWGVWRYSPLRHYRLKRLRSRSPYAGLMWWHHYAGLIFGLFTATWVFSGLLSMDPWDWHPGTSATREQRLAFAGASPLINQLTVDDLRRALSQLAGAREAEVVQSQGRMWLASDRGLAALTNGPGRLPLDAGSVRSLAERAMPGVLVTDIARLTDYDSYYYDRNRELPLPVLRISYGNPQRTSLYVDQARGVILRKEERLTRLNRWLYHGLHSLDFPFLYYRRPLWDVVVITLSLGGLLLTLAAVVPAWRRLRRHARHLWSAAS